jgi:hypothetical protein
MKHNRYKITERDIDLIALNKEINTDFDYLDEDKKKSYV